MSFLVTLCSRLCGLTAFQAPLAFLSSIKPLPAPAAPGGMGDCSAKTTEAITDQLQGGHIGNRGLSTKGDISSFPDASPFCPFLWSILLSVKNRK